MRKISQTEDYQQCRTIIMQTHIGGAHNLKQDAATPVVFSKIIELMKRVGEMLNCYFFFVTAQA